MHAGPFLGCLPIRIRGYPAPPPPDSAGVPFPQLRQAFYCWGDTKGGVHIAPERTHRPRTYPPPFLYAQAPSRYIGRGGGGQTIHF